MATKDRHEGAVATDAMREPIRRVRRRTVGVSAFVGAGLVATLVLSSWLGSWGPLFHSECALTEVANSGAFYLPLGLANSPYGGRASDNSTSPENAAMGYNATSFYQTVGGGWGTVPYGAGSSSKRWSSIS
jgi:hypothetical protein